eukprot:SAG31_NODE_2749_length_5147_cov_1.972662_7_plen_120_part_00
MLECIDSPQTISKRTGPTGSDCTAKSAVNAEQKIAAQSVWPAATEKPGGEEVGAQQKRQSTAGCLWSRACEEHTKMMRMSGIWSIWVEVTDPHTDNADSILCRVHIPKTFSKDLRKVQS